MSLPRIIHLFILITVQNCHKITAFIPSSFSRHSTKQTQIHHRRHNTSKRITLQFLRNFDLPEAVIFYGKECVFDGGDWKTGVQRLVQEAEDVGTASILLSESCTVSVLKDLVKDDSLTLCSSIEGGEEGRGLGHAPSPAALLDAIASVEIQPRGFGGSSGFGTKQADPPRPPLPKHCVVFVDNDNPNSGICRNRCSAARLAGMRVIYIESRGFGTCDAEDLADAVVSSLGDVDDFDVVTLDGISTPGSYWLNPPSARDDEGNRVVVDDVIQWFYESRSEGDGGEKKPIEDGMGMDGDDLSDGEISRILADLDPL